MIIGIPLEIKTDERRVALTPTDCHFLISNGCQIIIENNAGKLSGFENREYEKYGVQIVADAKTLFEKAQLIVKVKEPQASEIKLLNSRHTLFCFLHLGGNPDLSQALLKTGITGYAFETVGEDGHTPLLAPMSRIAGHLAVTMSAHFITSHYQGKGILLGESFLGHPGKMLILGAGMAGQSALSLAYAMGIEVYIADINYKKLQKIQSKYPNIRIIESNAANIAKILPEIDVLIGAVYVVGKTAPKLITREMIRMMQPGSVAFDISVDQGGCIETTRPCTHSVPTYVVDHIVHSCVANLPAAVPQSASIALSQQVHPCVLELVKNNISKSLQAGLNIENYNLAIDL